MLICLIESETNVIKPLVGKLTKNFPTEYIFHIRSRKISQNELNMLRQKPLLCPQWCIVIHCDTFSKETALTLAKSNVVIWQVSSKAAAVKIKGNSEDIMVIDNSKVSKDDAIVWIQRELATFDEISNTMVPANAKTALYLYNRVDGYIDYLAQAVSVLKFELGRYGQCELTKGLIDRYVVKVSPVKRYHILNILLGKECSYSKEKVVLYLSRCIYEWKSFKLYLLDELNDYKTVFEYEMSGELSLTNVLEFMKDNPSVELTDTKIKSILISHNVVSYERLLFLEMFISSLPDDALGACRFCNFVRALMDLLMPPKPKKKSNKDEKSDNTAVKDNVVGGK